MKLHRFNKGKWVFYYIDKTTSLEFCEIKRDWGIKKAINTMIELDINSLLLKQLYYLLYSYGVSESL